MPFDLTVHKRNKKGEVTHVQPYKLYIENGNQKFERPPNSGNFFDAAGNPLSKPKQAEPMPELKEAAKQLVAEASDAKPNFKAVEADLTKVISDKKK